MLWLCCWLFDVIGLVVVDAAWLLGRCPREATCPLEGTHNVNTVVDLREEVGPQLRENHLYGWMNGCVVCVVLGLVVTVVLLFGVFVLLVVSRLSHA